MFGFASFKHNDLHQMLPKVEWSDSETELLAVSWMQWVRPAWA
jgi:hypothetical protein